MKIARDIRVGNVFRRGGNLFVVLKAEFHKSTSGRRASTSEMKFKLRDLMTKNRTDMTLDATEKVDFVMLDKVPSQFLYKSEQYNFMNQETFEQFEMDDFSLGDATNFLKADAVVDILFCEGQPVGVELPITVDMKITYTEPGLRGDTTGKVTKPATLESGLEIQVPIFCNIGDIVKIDTRTSEYVERA